jgi:hypothetical protein
MRERNALAIVVMLATASALSACMPGAGPTASPSSSATDSAMPTPTPSPTPDVPVAASVAISAEAIAVLDAAGAPIATFDYFQPTADVVAGLSEHLGAPVDTPYTGGLESPPGVNHDWGGLRLIDNDAPVSAPYYGDHWVIVTGPDANGLPVGTPAGIGTTGGVHVGDALSAVTIGAEPPVDTLDSLGGRPLAYFRVGLLSLPPGGEYGDAPNLGITIVGYTESDTVQRFIAPSRNWGP